jgi:hypothetical protein
MDTMCEIPQGKEFPNDQVNDDLPTPEAIKIADAVEILDDKGERHTFKSVYGGPESPRRVVIFFIRHFFCGVKCPFLKICDTSNIISHVQAM